MASPRLDGRTPEAIRPLVFHRHWLSQVPGSVLVESGLTRVLCTAVIEDGVPIFLKNSNRGWLTAEYSMLPASTNTRKSRDKGGRVDGRSVEIQRLLGRALRSIVDLQALPARTIWIDCDVLQADGGTRTAAINGAYVALHDALTHAKQSGSLKRWPLRDSLQATSIGIVEGEARIDLCYYEDSTAEVDMNLIMTGSGNVVEVNGGAEQKPFPLEQMAAMVELGARGCAAAAEAQAAALAD